jgi:hypothetical protein
VARAVESRDAAGKILADAEVARAPCDLIAERKQAGGLAADRALAGGCGGVNVGVDAPGEVKASFRRRRDVE